jgi:uroporphyrinogen-III synthase
VSGLTGQRVAVTRPEPGGRELAELLRGAGAEPVMLPLIEIASPADPEPLRRAASALDEYDWIVFTSANAVRRVHEVLQPLRGETAAVPRGHVAAVGPATADAVRARLGWTVHAVPERYTGAEVVAAMRMCAPVTGARVLWPRAEAARDALPRDLAAAGAVVDAPVAYRTHARQDTARTLAGQLARGEIDVLLLASPSAVDALVGAGVSTGAAVVCVIGSTTGAAARKAGLPVHVEPEEHTIPALIDALRRYLRDDPQARTGAAQGPEES